MRAAGRGSAERRTPTGDDGPFGRRAGALAGRSLDSMNIGLALQLGVLALIDATSLGTLVIPVWFLLAAGRPPVKRILVYLAAVGVSYFLLGLALMAGLMSSFARLRDWTHGHVGATVLLYIGLTMLVVGACMPSPRPDAGPGPMMRRISRWRERALTEEGGARALVTLAVVAVAVEAASMIPYLAAIGLMSASPAGSAARVGMLAAYCVVMVAPAVVLLAARVGLGTRLDPALRRFGAWVERTSGENVAWALAVIGVLVTRSAWSAGARPPWF